MVAGRAPAALRLGHADPVLPVRVRLVGRADALVAALPRELPRALHHTALNLGALGPYRRTGLFEFTSDRLRRLKEDLGGALFLRTTRRVELSQAGVSLLPIAREMIARAEEMRAILRGPARRAPYELCLGTRYELGLSWLCPSLTALQRAVPERTIHLHNGDTPDLQHRLERGDLDAVVASMRLTSPRLSYAALHAEEYTIVSTRSCLRKRDDARALTLLDVSRDLPLFRYFLDALPDAEPWPFDRVEYLGGIGNLRRRLLDGDGRVAVLPRYFIRQDLAARRLVRLMPRVRLRPDSFRLVWRTDHPRAGEIRRLAAERRARPLQ